MKTTIQIVAVLLVTATNAAPLTTRCMELLNSTGPYAYCDVTTTTSQGDRSLVKLVNITNNVTETFQSMCETKEIRETLCSSCDQPDDVEYATESNRDVQNDQINGQLEMLLLKLQELNATCGAELSSGNSSFLDVCTTLKIKLQYLTKHISDYLEIEKCGCPGKAETCHYEPDKEIPNDGEDKSLKQVFCEIYSTNVLTERLLTDIHEARRDTGTEN